MTQQFKEILKFDYDKLSQLLRLTDDMINADLHNRASKVKCRTIRGEPTRKGARAVLAKIRRLPKGCEISVLDSKAARRLYRMIQVASACEAEENKLLLEFMEISSFGLLLEPKVASKIQMFYRFEEKEWLKKLCKLMTKPVTKSRALAADAKGWPVQLRNEVFVKVFYLVSFKGVNVNRAAIQVKADVGKNKDSILRHYRERLEWYRRFFSDEQIKQAVLASLGKRDI